MKNYCKDCGKQIWKTAKRCHKCANKIVNKNKRKPKNYCVDCRKEIDRRSERCPSCCVTGKNHPFYRKKHTKKSRKKMSEIKKGKNNPFYGKFHSKRTIEKLRQARLKQIFPIKDTSIEIVLQDALKFKGIVFRTHEPIMGQPDIFIEPNVCIFADGDYWHNWPNGKEKDKKITQSLKNQGYKVIRFWEHEINNNISSCINQIETVV